jgi:8-amino-7-oxononanoate synthase
VDDSQALGLLGREPEAEHPYGWGGGGSPAWRGISSPRLLTLSSLAKSFGVPLAALTGAGEAIAIFERESETRVCSSPPSVAAIRAAEAALCINRERGDRLRALLLKRVRCFRERLREAGLAASGGLSPVQNLEPPRGVDPVVLFQRLRGAGMRIVLRQPRCQPGPRITFLLHANHSTEEIDRAVETVARTVRLLGRIRHERPGLRSLR